MTDIICGVGVAVLVLVAARFLIAAIIDWKEYN
jgi:hypothetical protein